jgi:hypothetical protein
LKNSDVHSIGVTALYLGSKYEDVFPINSHIVSERISHKAVPQKDILALEEEYLRLFDFNLELVTPFDFHEYLFGYLNSQFTCPEDLK